MPNWGRISTWSYKNYKNNINHQFIRDNAPSAKMHSYYDDKTYESKFTKLCNAIDNEMKDAIVYEVENDDEGKLLLDNLESLTNFSRSRYDGVKVRYIFKDIDYDRMAEQQVFEILAKSDDADQEKRERAMYVKNMNRLKKNIDNFQHTIQSYHRFLSTEFSNNVLTALADFGPMYEAKKKEMTEEKKQANKNKVSIRQKLARFAVYNSESRKKE
jgi:hypothetical protein